MVLITFGAGLLGARLGRLSRRTPRTDDGSRGVQRLALYREWFLEVTRWVRGFSHSCYSRMSCNPVTVGLDTSHLVESN